VKWLLIITLFFSLNIQAESTKSRLVKNIFSQAQKEVASFIPFDHEYQLIVTDKELIDNRGSLVDALGTPGKIILNEEAWMNFYRQGIDVRLLVLHEIHRAKGIDDDGYAYSLPIYEEIVSKEDIDKKRNKTPYCLLRTSEYTYKEKTKRIRKKGNSQPMGNTIMFPNPYATEATENAIKLAKEDCLNRGYEEFRYVEGYIKIENGLWLFILASLLWYKPLNMTP